MKLLKCIVGEKLKGELDVIIVKEGRLVRDFIRESSVERWFKEDGMEEIVEKRVFYRIRRKGLKRVGMLGFVLGEKVDVSCV